MGLLGGIWTKGVATLLLPLLFVQTSLAANSTCAEALHTFLAKVFLLNFSLFFNLLSKVAPVFDPKDKSLTLELLEISDLSAGGCRTPFYSVELWRVIQQPGISLPKDFGSTEYFGKDQHCENPNPDLLSRQDRHSVIFTTLFCQLVISDSFGCIYDLMISTVCL